MTRKQDRSKKGLGTHTSEAWNLRLSRPTGCRLSSARGSYCWLTSFRPNSEGAKATSRILPLASTSVARLFSASLCASPCCICVSGNGHQSHSNGRPAGHAPQTFTTLPAILASRLVPYSRGPQQAFQTGPSLALQDPTSTHSSGSSV